MRGLMAGSHERWHVSRCLLVGVLVMMSIAACAGPGSRSSSTNPTRGTLPVKPRVGQRWAPVPGQPWQWQLTSPVATSVNVPVYDIDGFENGAQVVARLHVAGRHVICYIDVGGWEGYRPDAASLPASVLGRAVEGWPQERWVDIRRLDVVGPALAARFDMCKAKGFDAIEPDMLDAYANASGFPLTAADQLRFNTYVAGLVHQRDMSVALKGDIDQAGALVQAFDFAINEQCAQYGECTSLLPFVDAGKAVLHVEYGMATDTFCPITVPLGFSSMKKRPSLDAWRQPCP
jgi:hypothetical protein